MAAVDAVAPLSNPAAGLRIAHRVEQHDEAHVKALSEEELRALLLELPAEWRVFFEFLAHTGLRIGEAVALTWADVDFGRRRVHVRRRLYRGRYDAPKSKYGRRAIPLSESLSRALWRLRGAGSDQALVFTTGTGNSPGRLAPGAPNVIHLRPWHRGVPCRHHALGVAQA